MPAGRDLVESGRQAMKVNLSASWRQLRCMAYSSSRLSGSEAVASWISWAFVNMIPLTDWVGGFGGCV